MNYRLRVFLGAILSFAVNGHLEASAAPFSGFSPELVTNVGDVSVKAIDAVVIDGEPAFFYVARDSGHLFNGVRFTQRQSGNWVTSTVFSHDDAGHAVDLEAMSVSGMPKVAVNVVGAPNEIRIYSRSGAAWNEEFSRNLNGFAADTALGFTVADNLVVGIVADDPRGYAYTQDYHLIEQTAAGYGVSSFHVSSGVITTVNAATINGQPHVLMVNGDTMLSHRQNEVWAPFEAVASQVSYGELAAWNDRPAFIASHGGTDPSDILFHYLDASGQWQSEVVTTHRNRAFDMAVVGDMPIVAYVDVSNLQGLSTLHVAIRGESGNWYDSTVGNVANNWVNGISVFDLNGAPAIAYIDQANNLYLVESVPEPSTWILAASAWLCLTICRRRPAKIELPPRQRTVNG